MSECFEHGSLCLPIHATLKRGHRAYTTLINEGALEKSGSHLNLAKYQGSPEPYGITFEACTRNHATDYETGMRGSNGVHQSHHSKQDLLSTGDLPEAEHQMCQS
jgi:hypothetical protein